MRLTVELSEIINLKKKDDEKGEIYTHVFKYKETDDEFYYYGVYKYYQEGKGHIVYKQFEKIALLSPSICLPFLLLHEFTSILIYAYVSSTRALVLINGWRNMRKRYSHQM